jgi:two-component system, NarL family, nitrate/nitrite response regulator NarL
VRATTMCEPREIKVAVIDADPLFRDGVVKAFNAQPGFAVVAIGATGRDAIDIAHAHCLDIMLIDPARWDCGSPLVAQVKQVQPHIKVVLLARSEDEDHIAEALRAGAQGYVLKRISGPDLMQALCAVHAGEEYIPPGLATRLLLIKKPEVKVSVGRNAVDSLNAREEQILLLLMRGMTNREIAAEIRLSLNTVSRYVTNLLQKMHVRNRVEAAVVAVQRPLGSAAERDVSLRKV